MTHADYFEGVTSSMYINFPLCTTHAIFASNHLFILYFILLANRWAMLPYECASNQAKRNSDRSDPEFLLIYLGDELAPIFSSMHDFFMNENSPYNYSYNSTMCLGDNCDKTPHTINFSTFLKWKKNIRKFVLENASFLLHNMLSDESKKLLRKTYTTAWEMKVLSTL